MLLNINDIRKISSIESSTNNVPHWGGATYIIIKGHVGGGWGAFNQGQLQCGNYDLHTFSFSSPYFVLTLYLDITIFSSCMLCVFFNLFVLKFNSATYLTHNKAITIFSSFYFLRAEDDVDIEMDLMRRGIIPFPMSNRQQKQRKIKISIVPTDCQIFQTFSSTAVPTAPWQIISCTCYYFTQELKEIIRIGQFQRKVNGYGHHHRI